MEEELRVRFAPSPTGYLHIGGVRTALFNYLFARHHKGKFILRIEDTDKVRSTKESVDTIINGLTWLGLSWDEGPYFQSERTALYKSHAEKLLLEGKAYKCYCSPEELEEKRKRAITEKRKPVYDRTCRERADQSTGKPYAIRFKSPFYGTTVVRDMIKGDIVFNNEELEDFIIVRSDGSPIYNLVVVADDLDMHITHVIRGDDHLNNTVKQIFLYNALGYPAPQFAHIPLIHGTDKARLSKRHGATSVEAYKEAGYLPEALVNYLVRLGWSFGDKEIFTMREMIESFSFKSISKSAAIFNPEKLLWLNAVYMRMKSAKELLTLCEPFIIARGLKYKTDLNFLKLIDETKIRARTLVELLDMMDYYFKQDIEYDQTAVQKFFKSEKLPYLETALSRISTMNEFSRDSIKKAIKEIVTDKEIKLGDIAQPLRLAITGRTVSPGLFEIMEILGKTTVIDRITKAIQYIRNKNYDGGYKKQHAN